MDELGGCSADFCVCVLFQMKSWAVMARRFGLYIAWIRWDFFDLFETMSALQRHVWLVHFHCMEQESKINPDGSITQTWQLYPLPGPIFELSVSLSPSLEITNKTFGIMCCGERCVFIWAGAQVTAANAVPELSPAALSILRRRNKLPREENVARKLGRPHVLSFFAWFIFPKKKKPRGKIIHMVRLHESNAQR